MLPTTTAVPVAAAGMAYYENASVLSEFRPHPSNPATWERQDRAKFTPLNNSIPLSLKAGGPSGLQIAFLLLHL